MSFLSLPLMEKEGAVISKGVFAQLSWSVNTDAHDKNDAMLNAVRHVCVAWLALCFFTYLMGRKSCGQCLITTRAV